MESAPPVVVGPSVADGAFVPAVEAARGEPHVDQRGFEMTNAIIGDRYHLTYGIGRGKFGRCVRCCCHGQRAAADAAAAVAAAVWLLGPRSPD
eukprot:COSAG01_NODE_17441_length_1151_cov_2.282319_1_plen_92_part_01